MITNSIAQQNQTLKGIHRSRFSFHFNFFNRRRWLLVQLVTAPSISAPEEDTNISTYTPQPRRGLANPLDEYSINRFNHALI